MQASAVSSEVVSAILGAAIGAIGLIAVAWINRGGKKAAQDQSDFTPSDNSQHSRTRDAIHSMRREMHLRFDAQDNSTGVARQQTQFDLSAQRIVDGEE